MLAFYPTPLYSAYAELSSRPGGISALGDQRLAAGVMWVPGSIPFALAILFDVYRLLGRSGAAQRRLAPRQAEAGGTVMVTVVADITPGALTLVIPLALLLIVLAAAWYIVHRNA